MRSEPSRTIKVLKYCFIICCLFFFLMPIVWTFATSFKTPNEIMHDPPIWIPSAPSLQYYLNVITGPGGKALLNSLFIAGANTLLSLIIGIPAAHAMARYNIGGKHLPFWFLSQRMIPPIALIIPIFMMYRLIGWLDTYHGVIIIYLVFNLPYVIWMMRGFFNEIPMELEESAKVDGCSSIGALIKITLPLVRNGIIATATFCFIFSWTEFILALVLTQTDVLTLPVFLTGQFGSQFTLWGEISAISILAAIPIFTFTLIFNRYLVRGLTMGAIK